MTQSDHSGRRPPRRASQGRNGIRTDGTRPVPARPGGRRGGARRPWPTAATTTRVSPGKPTAGTGRTQSRGPASTPTPATVWTAGTDPIPLDTTWPTALLERIVTAFSEPAAQVVLLDWPTPHHPRPTRTAAGADRAADDTIDPARSTDPDPELRDAATVVEHLDRTVRVEHVPIETTATGPASRPFWADLLDGSGPAPTTTPMAPMAPAATGDASASNATTEPIDGADLIVTSRLSHRSRHHVDGRGDGQSDGHAADLVALYAARRLRVGGILVVLTHCDWTTGQLIDPTGAVVSAGQNADLLYLQPVVAAHVPVRDGHFHLADTHPATHPDHPQSGPGGGIGDQTDADIGQARARHRAVVRGMPEPHRRIHSDVLVFAQPHNHQPTHPASSSAPTASVPHGEDLR